MRTMRRRAGALLTGALLLAGCDGGPKGPGVLDAAVDAPGPIGAVVLQIDGYGITGFTGQGDTRAFGAQARAATELEPARHRVVLVDGDGTGLRFGIRVDDLSAEPPLVTVVLAAGTDNRPTLLTGLVPRVDEP